MDLDFYFSKHWSNKIYAAAAAAAAKSLSSYNKDTSNTVTQAE